MSLYDKLSKFPIITEAGATGNTNAGTGYIVYKYISGLTAGDIISKVTIDIYNMSGNLKSAVYTTTGSGTSTSPDQKIAETGAKTVSVSNTYTTVTFDLITPVAVPSNGIVWVGWYPDANYLFRSTGGSALYTSSKHGAGNASANYGDAMPQTAWVNTSGDMGNGGNNLRAGVGVIGSVAKQRFVENFSGSALDTDRWSTVNIAGTNTFAMADDLDGGFKITAGSTNQDRGMINFGGIRQYNPQGFELIATYSNGNIITGMYYVGLTNGDDFPASAVNRVYSSQGNDNGNIQLVTAIGSSYTTVNSTTARSQDVTKTIKLTGTSTKSTMTINGVDEVESTTNLPTDKMQPACLCYSEAGGGTDHTMNIKYMEAYNT
jgi:hypothetical protein